ncbi:succinylglutamate desuccinylase/aspartoacylase family protein [Kaistia granuli]|uniref:succinylglutamate desuccinylase/aspartoacylase family protein n=1 Tax=Kaistia granuli TaxID=363259 RepID=UPI00036B336F|nr:succinylglutamate desuccinylase/aspartoacylase family protein [Kaistia granuli]
MLQPIDFDKAGKTFHDIVIPTEAGPVSAGRLCVINNGPGPRVLVVAGIHGDEYEAQLSLHRLVAAIDAEAVRGRLILIPEANFPASSQGARCAPSDGTNMNRTFPGNASGTPTERLSHFLFHEVLPQVDLVIDVHSGGPTYKGEAIAFAFHTPECAVSEPQVVAMMEAFRLPYITYQDGISSTLVGAAAEAGIAAIELEGGGTTLVHSTVADEFLVALQEGLKHFGVLDGAPKATGRLSRHLDVRPENMFETEVAGLLEHHVAMGQKVETGTIVAVVYPFGAFDQEPHPVLARAPGIVISQRSLLSVKPGDCLGNTGTPR